MSHNESYFKFCVEISLDTPTNSELVSLEKVFQWTPIARYRKGIQVWTDYYRANISHFKA